MKKQGNTRNIVAKFLLISSSIIGLIHTSAHARNGFIPQYVGFEGLVSGAGTTAALDATGVINNPAVLSRLNNHIILMGGGLRQDQYVDTSAAAMGNPIGPQRNRYKNTMVRTFGANYRYNENWAVGIGVSGGGGFAKYRQPVINPGMLNPANSHFHTQVINAVTLYAPTVSYSPNPSQSYGISLLVGHSHFRADLALSNLGFTQTSGAKRWDDSVGYGVRAGGIWDVTELLTLGASVASPVYFPKHSKYKDVFTYGMKIPGTFRVGTGWHLTKQTDLYFDFKGLMYGEAKWLSTETGWHNQFIFLTGIMHRFNDKVTVGCGYNYAKPPIRKKHVLVNSFSVPIEKHHVQTGVIYKLNQTLDVAATVWYSPWNKMTDNGQVIPGGASAGATIKAKAYGWEVGLKINL